MEELSLREKQQTLLKHFGTPEDVNRANRGSVSSKCVNRRIGKERTKYKDFTKIALFPLKNFAQDN